MAEERSTLERQLLTIAGVLAAVSGVAGGLTSIWKQASGLGGAIAGLSVAQMGVAALLLVLGGAWLILLSRRRRSILRRPEALLLDRSNPTHLIGRSAEIDQLVTLCRGEAIVFLEGESGAGKTALLQAGLCAKLSNHPYLAPVFLDSISGPDWESWPLALICRTLEGPSPPMAPASSDIELSVGRLERALQAFSATTHRVPLLIIDQFDDYQMRHRDKFLNDNTWLSSEALASQNAFWKQIEIAVRACSLKLLVATRTDTAAGLRSIEFVPARTLRLDGLDARFLGQIFEMLASATGGSSGAEIIRDPDFGWTRLRDRIAGDLERGGAILPQRLKVVLAGLTTLPRQVLTTAAYIKAGGASGLEARFIDDRICHAAKLHGSDEKRVRRALVALVDPETRRKTVTLPQDRLLELIGGSRSDAQAVLACLERDKILRPRLGRSPSDLWWQLDHDYLAGPLEAAELRANRSQLELREGAKSFASPGANLVARWRAMLPLTSQISLLYRRILGRFRYGPDRGYAILSAFRSMTVLVLFVLVPMSFFMMSLYARQEAVMQRELARRQADLLQRSNEHERRSTLQARAMLEEERRRNEAEDK